MMENDDAAEFILFYYDYTLFLFILFYYYMISFHYYNILYLPTLLHQF